MAFTLLAGGTTLYIVSQDGTLRTLTLPAGVVLTSLPSRVAVLGNVVVIVNGPTEPLWINGRGEVKRFTILKPTRPPTLADGGGSGYTGTRRAKASFLVKDDAGRVEYESDLSDASASVTVANKLIAFSDIPLSPNPSVNGRRIYLTADSGTEYFAAFDLDDNTTTTFSDATSDEALDVLAAPTDLGAAPPRISIIAAYRNRLVGRAASDVDTLFISTAGKFYAWPTQIPVGSKGADPYGLTGFLSRRNVLGVLRHNELWKLVGDDEDTFEPVRVVDDKGSRATDAAIVVHDIGYFLGNDGFYSWDDDGVRCVSDDRVHPWFATDDYFNRSQFHKAFAAHDPRTDAVVLFLCSAGATTIDRWVSYEIGTGRWMGPHKTAAFTPAAAAASIDTNGNEVFVVAGTDGWLYSSQIGATASDGLTTAIEFDALLNPLCGDPPNPDMEHYFGRASVFTKKQSAGSLSLIPHVGALDASAGATIAIDLTAERNVTRRLGTGRLLQLRFLKTAAGGAIDAIYGLKFPWHSLGRR